MTPQEKARELVDMFEPFCYSDPRIQVTAYDCARQCAIIAVDELIDFAKLTDATNGWDHLNYWIQVKHELTKQEQ